MKNIKRDLSMMDKNKHFHPETILSEAYKIEFAQRLKSFKAIKNNSTVEPKTAAVLVPLCIYKDELGLLYTLRSTKLNSNRGQVSFPGGMRDENDKNFEETALRETWEELSIPMDSVDVWSNGNLIGRKHVNVMPVFGFIGNIEPEKLKINPQEVEEAFVVSLKNLCNPDNLGFTQFRDNYTLPLFLGNKHRIWGLTALITHICLKALLHDVYKHKMQFLQPIEKLIKKS